MHPQPAWLQKLIRLPDVDANLKSFGGHKQAVAYGWQAEKEAHFAFEIMLILKGEQLTIFQGSQQLFRAGDIVLIPPGKEHENMCVSKEGMAYFCIHFDIDDPFIQQELLMYCPLLLEKTVPAYQQIQSILTSYVELLDSTEITFKQKLFVEKLLIELVICLLDYAESQKAELASSDNDTLLLAVTIADTIQNNFRLFTAQPTEEHLPLLSLNGIARQLSISDSTMLKAFKKIYHMTPKEYLNQLKYNEAKYLLHQPAISVAEVAEIIGYQNVSHFSRQFKKWSHYSPNQYRQMDTHEVIKTHE